MITTLALLSLSAVGFATAYLIMRPVLREWRDRRADR